MPIRKSPEEEKAELVLELERQLKFLKGLKDVKNPDRLKEDVARVEAQLSELKVGKSLVAKLGGKKK